MNKNMLKEIWKNLTPKLTEKNRQILKEYLKM